MHFKEGIAHHALEQIGGGIDFYQWKHCHIVATT